jgi:hypothetical protein
MLAVNFVELRKGEVQHSRTPIRPGPPPRGCSYGRVLCARRWNRNRGGLRETGWGNAGILGSRGRSKSQPLASNSRYKCSNRGVAEG